MTLRVDIRVRRGGFDLEASFEAGGDETVALLGPNGAGKSTIVEVVAGLLVPDAGSLILDGRPLDPLLPHERGLGVVFQEGRLFPHLRALDNVAFPLRAAGRSKPAARRAARGWLERVGLGAHTDARPVELSGGERQRVALARALIGEPRILLLDEPLASVDVSAKAGLRSLLRDVLGDFTGPRILVTHDPVEATTLADRLVIVEEGRISQTGTPPEIRRMPATPYVADLVGTNLFRGRLEPLQDGAGVLRTADGDVWVAWPAALPRTTHDEALATVRPADVALHRAHPEGSPRNVVEGDIAEVAVHGERARVRLRSLPPVTAEVTLGSVARLELEPGIRVWASFKAVEVRIVVAGDEPATLGR